VAIVCFDQAPFGVPKPDLRTMTPRFATTVAPLRRTGLQAACLARWTVTGCDVTVLNGSAEAAEWHVHAPGAAPVDILAPDSLAPPSVGRPLPRLVAVLDHLAALPDRSPVVLGPSDLWPATQTAGWVEQWLRTAPALALTRERVAILEAASLSDPSPDRSRFDAFVLSAAVLPRLAALLRARPGGDMLCLGAPGWDLVMAAAIIHPQIGGVIRDGAFLLHEVHGSEARAVPAETAALAAGLAGFGGKTADDPALGLHGLATASVQAAAQQCDRMRAAYFRMVAPLQPPGPAAVMTAMRLQSLAPFIRWTCPLHVLAACIARQTADRAPDLPRAMALFDRGGGQAHRFAQMLAAILLLLETLPHEHRAAITTSYQAGNRHAEALALIRSKTADAPLRQRVAIAELFASELADHGILNTRLIAHLALCCENEAERALIAAIDSHARTLAHAA
jgi:hypothetical protein